MTKAMKGRTLAESICAEISDAMDLLDEITVEDHEADAMGRAELALTRAREMVVDKGALSLFAAAPAMLAALEEVLSDLDTMREPYRNEAICERIRAAIAAAIGTPTGDK